VVGTGDAGTCNIDTSAVRWEFVGTSTDVCTSVSNPVALCPGNEASFTCVFDDNVAWSFVCTIPQSQFPSTAVTITSLTATIKQEDNFTFTGDGPAGTSFEVAYSTGNTILPAGSFGNWPDTPIKLDTGVIPASGTVTFSDSSDVASITLQATGSGIAFAQNSVSSGNGASFLFQTSQEATASGFESNEFFPVFSRVSVTLIAVYV